RGRAGAGSGAARCRARCQPSPWTLPTSCISNPTDGWCPRPGCRTPPGQSGEPDSLPGYLSHPPSAGACMSRLARTLLAAVGTFVLVFGAGCGGGARPTRDAGRAGVTLRLVNTAGLSIAAVDMGTGQMGVVLAHQSDASMCQWLPYAK